VSECGVCKAELADGTGTCDVCGAEIEAAAAGAKPETAAAEAPAAAEAKPETAADGAKPETAAAGAKPAAAPSVGSPERAAGPLLREAGFGGGGSSGFQPTWLYGFAAILLAVAAVLWVVLHYTVGPERGGPCECRREESISAGGGGVGLPEPRGGDRGPEGDVAPEERIDPTALPWRGAEDPILAIVEFGDYECEFTRRAEAVVDRLVRRYPADLRLLFVHAPSPIHDYALPAAAAAEAARRQDRFGPMHVRLMESGGRMERGDLLRLADELGMDRSRFERDLDGAAMDAVRRMATATRAAGIRATPHFAIGGRVVEGARSEEEFVAAVEAALADARRSLDRGARRDEVYAESLTVLTGSR
jgi:hypothetical protein